MSTGDSKIHLVNKDKSSARIRICICGRTEAAIQGSSARKRVFLGAAGVLILEVVSAVLIAPSSRYLFLAFTLIPFTVLFPLRLIRRHSILCSLNLSLDVMLVVLFLLDVYYTGS